MKNFLNDNKSIENIIKNKNEIKNNDSINNIDNIKENKNTMFKKVEVKKVKKERNKIEIVKNL